jgi:hypothetical protein
MISMNEEVLYDHFLIRESTIVVRIARGAGGSEDTAVPEFFDVRTGVQLREIHPPFHSGDLEHAHKLSKEYGEAIIRSGRYGPIDYSVDFSKVVSILEVKQRRLDYVVADSILGQVRVIHDLLDQFLKLAEKVNDEERFWLSQQVLSLLSKFTGRELEELEEMVNWMSTRPRKQ